MLIIDKGDPSQGHFDRGQDSVGTHGNSSQIMGVQASVFDVSGENICKWKALQCNSKSHCIGRCSRICSNIRFVICFLLI